MVLQGHRMIEHGGNLLIYNPSGFFPFFKNCCSSTVFYLSPHPSPSPLPTTLALPTCVHCFHPPFVIVHMSFIIVPVNPSPFPLLSLPSPLWSLSACSQFQCLWLYSACLFILLIRFLLMVRSYSICLSPPGLFHFV